jgi:hypothetical protein
MLRAPVLQGLKQPAPPAKREPMTGAAGIIPLKDTKFVLSGESCKRKVQVKE